MNYNLEMENFISKLECRPKLMLHVCCAPCLCGVIGRIYPHFDLTLYFYNPNIYPREEYDLRLSEVKRFISADYKDIKTIEGEYDQKKFDDNCLPYASDAEGGERCRHCIDLRLKQTYDMASKLDFDYFCSTLSVSPHKDADFINSAAMALSECGGRTKWLKSDFKKKDGFKQSIKVSEQYGIYRQNYCGCKYSFKCLNEL